MEGSAQARGMMPPPRRAVTMPTRPPDSARNDRSVSSNAIETLYVHPSVRIVSFESSLITDPSKRTSVSVLYEHEHEEIGKLTPASSREKTIAVGSLKIYRAPGSVAFINCGRVIQPIMAKSRCWCVDDDSSKFVLQMRKPLFWRIELPLTEPSHATMTENLKSVLAQIMLFEKTPCPFKRNFHVELPEPPSVPIIKKPWRPKERPSTASSESTSAGSPNRAASLKGGASSIERHEPVTVVADEGHYELSELQSHVEQPRSQGEEQFDPEDKDDVQKIVANIKQISLSTPSMPKNVRSVTAPQLHPPQPVETQADPETTVEGNDKDNVSEEPPTLSSSQDSFHSLESWHSPLTPSTPAEYDSHASCPTSYPYPHDNIIIEKRQKLPSSLSTITNDTDRTSQREPHIESPNTPRVWEMTRTPSNQSLSDTQPSSPPLPQTPTPRKEIQQDLDEEHLEIPPQPTPHAPGSFNAAATLPRRRASISERYAQRRALSPLPPARNLLMSPKKTRGRHLTTAKHIPTMIIQKTWEILMSPPGHLVGVMLDIAAKINSGHWKDLVFGVDYDDESAGKWDWETQRTSGFDGWQDEEEEMDDFGMTRAVSQNSIASFKSAKSRKGSESPELRKRMPSRPEPPGGFGESWEID